MATKVKQRLLGIFDYAVERGLIPGNPLPRRRRVKVKRKHFPAVTDRKGVGEILRAADKADISRGVRRAHLLATFTAQRLGVIKNARWSEFDLEAGTWTISRKRMKKKEAARGDHVVTLAPKLLAQMIEWRRADGGDAEYTCPAPRVGGHISDSAVEKFYRVTLGLKDKHSPHSWRTVMKSWAADAGQPDDLAKSSLDHGIGNKTDQSYDDAKRIDRRREFVKWYEDSLIAARDGAAVTSIQRRA
jgi:integrase